MERLRHNSELTKHTLNLYTTWVGGPRISFPPPQSLAHPPWGKEKELGGGKGIFPYIFSNGNKHLMMYTFLSTIDRRRW